jgi:hypothetical protein
MKGVVYGRNTTISNCTVGKCCRFGYDNLIYCSAIGDYTYTASNTKIYYAYVGSFCSISWNVSIGGFEHPVHRISTHGFSYQPLYSVVKKVPEVILNQYKKTFIGHDVWVGCNAYIKAGVKVGNGAVIGASAVVTKDVPSYAVVAGNPAQVLKYRFSEDIINVLDEMKWWDWPPDQMKRRISLFQKDIKNIGDLCDSG